MDPRHHLGARGEALVARHLEALGYQIVARNLRVGRLEIDLVARRGRVLAFCEVRSRTNADFGSPLESLDAAKLARIRLAAQTWARGRNLRGVALRFDAAAVLFDVPDGRLEVYVEDAF